MIWAVVFLLVIIIQRLVEVAIAKSNEKWMKSQGAQEFGQSHYRLMVLMHTAFFVCLITEGLWLKPSISSLWPLWIGLFILTQIARIWVLTSLGKYWNTKIIVLPNAKVVSKGPYRFVRHPNYVIVTIELIIIPLAFNAFVTLFLFAVLNQIILTIRIQEEEKALIAITNYEEEMKSKFKGVLLPPDVE